MNLFGSVHGCNQAVTQTVCHHFIPLLSHKASLPLHTLTMLFALWHEGASGVGWHIGPFKNQTKVTRGCLSPGLKCFLKKDFRDKKRSLSFGGRNKSLCCFVSKEVDWVHLGIWLVGLLEVFHAWPKEKTFQRRSRTCWRGYISSQAWEHRNSAGGAGELSCCDPPTYKKKDGWLNWFCDF